MATILVSGPELVVRLSLKEKFGAFRSDVRVPVVAVRTVRVSADAWHELRGLRAPGTGWPGVIALGTRRGGEGGNQFAAVYRDRPAIVIELEGAEFARLIISLRDPDRVAEQIRSVIPHAQEV